MNNDDPWPSSSPLEVIPPPVAPKHPGLGSALERVAREGASAAAIGAVHGLLFGHMLDFTRPKDKSQVVAETTAGTFVASVVLNLTSLQARAHRWVPS